MKSEFFNLLDVLLVNSRSHTETVALWIVGFFSLILLLNRLGGVFGLQATRWPRAIPSGLIAMILSLGVLVLLRVYVVPELGSPAIRIAVQATGVIVVTLAVVLPIHCFLMKGNYVETLIAYAVSLAGAAMIMVAVRTVWHGILDGMASADKQKERKEQVEREISN